MSNLSFSSLNSALSSTQFGCKWCNDNQLIPLLKPVITDTRIIVIGQLLATAALYKILNEVSTLVNVVSVKLNEHNNLCSSSFGIDIYIESKSGELNSIEEGVTKQDLCKQLSLLAQTYLLDLVLQTEAPSLSKSGLLVMDMDSTMIEIECIDEIARLANRYEDVSKVTSMAMNGKLGFADSLHSRVACLEGVELFALESIRNKLPLMPGLWNLVSTLRNNNWKVAIASGGFTYFADYLKNWLELDYSISNILDIENDMLTGKTKGEVIDAEVKARTLRELAKEWHIEKDQTCAIGDGANDLQMIAEASMGVAFHAKASVRAQAGYAISYQPLDALLLLIRA